MKGFNRDQSNRWWLAVVLSMPVALAAALLMLFFPLTQAAQASQIPTVKSLPASQETTGLSSSSVITIGVGTCAQRPRHVMAGHKRIPFNWQSTRRTLQVVSMLVGQHTPWRSFLLMTDVTPLKP